MITIPSMGIFSACFCVWFRKQGTPFDVTNIRIILDWVRNDSFFTMCKNYEGPSPAERQVSGWHRCKVGIDFLKRHAPVIPNVVGKISEGNLNAMCKNYEGPSPAEGQVSGWHRCKVGIDFLKRHAPVIPNVVGKANYFICVYNTRNV